MFHYTGIVVNERAVNIMWLHVSVRTKNIQWNDLLRPFCVLLVFPCRFKAILRVIVSLFTSLYIQKGKQWAYIEQLWRYVFALLLHFNPSLCLSKNMNDFFFKSAPTQAGASNKTLRNFLQAKLDSELNVPFCPKRARWSPLYNA